MLLSKIKYQLHINEISTGVPQGSVLGPLLFLIYINDLHKCMKYSKTYHFADDTSILQSHSSLQILSKQINKDLFNLSNWLKANKLSLNIKKTELALFRPKKLKSDHIFKFKMDGKRLIPIHSVKYFRVLLDEHMYSNEQTYQVKQKLNCTIGMKDMLKGKEKSSHQINRLQKSIHGAPFLVKRDMKNGESSRQHPQIIRSEHV